MEKSYWKKILALLLLAISLAGIAGCQDGKKPASAISDEPPGADADDTNRLVATMGTVNLGKKKIIDYLQSLDPVIVKAALNRQGGLEDLVKGIALRANVVTRSAGQNWQDRPEVKAKIEEAQRNVLYSMYVNEQTALPENYPDDATVAQVYNTTQQQQTAAGKPALKPLDEIAAVIKQKLREKQKQANEQNYLAGLVSSNPIAVDMRKLVGYINLPQEEKQQQGEPPLKEPVARMGNLSVSLGLAIKSLASLELKQQQQLFSDTQQLQQYLQRLTIQYFVLNEAIAAKFNARPLVNNHMEQARMQALYATYMQAWSAPEAEYPSASLIEENYRNNLQKLVVEDRYYLAKIVIKNSDDAAGDALKVKQLASAARASGADFSALARQFSMEPQSAENGGNVGWINIQALAPELKQMISTSQLGAVLGPVQYQWGWQLIKVVDHQPARTQTLDEARPALVNALRAQRQAEKEKEIIEQLVASEPVKIDKAALQQLRQQISG